jgi:hypothetical protein
MHEGADVGAYAMGVNHTQLGGNALFWRAADLLAWWEEQYLPPGTARSYDMILRDWCSSPLGKLVLATHPIYLNSATGIASPLTG